MNEGINAQMQTDADDAKMMEVEESEIKIMESKQSFQQKIKPGKGKAICGYKDASDVFDRVM